MGALNACCSEECIETTREKMGMASDEHNFKKSRKRLVLRYLVANNLFGAQSIL